VISFWAGLRPLIAEPRGRPSDISRSHQIRRPEPGWWDVAGGKLTTYRRMAEQTVDKVAQWLNAQGLGKPLAPCRTAQEPLLPAAETAEVSGIVPPAMNRKTVEHYVGKEWAVHLDDVMLRRAGWHYYFADAPQRAERVADWMGELLGWAAEVRQAELERYTQAVALTPDAKSAAGAASPQQALSSAS
jgi:glycerol-3-phosphate dehydrogenase